MSIWGKLVGGMTGMMVGGPLGAMMGASVGHLFYDRNPFRNLFNPMAFMPGWQGFVASAKEQGRQSGFAMGVVLLSAKVARASGLSEADGFAALIRVASIGPEEQDGVRGLYSRAWQSDNGPETVTAVLSALFENSPGLLDEILEALGMIAAAAGRLEQAAPHLQAIAEDLGRPGRDWRQYRAGPGTKGTGPDPWQVLGVAPDSDEAAIRAAYRRLLRETHPDTLMAQGLPEEFIAVANRRMADINAAWDEISRQRGYRR